MKKSLSPFSRLDLNSRSIFFRTVVLSAVRKTAFFFVLLTPVAAFAADPFIILGLNGTVDVRLAKETEWKPAVKGQKVPGGSTVRTGKSSRASLLFKNGSNVWLKENTTLDIDQQFKENLIGLSQGSIKVRVPHLKFREKFHVKTPTSLAAVRGTIFTADANEGGEMTLQVLFGEVTFKYTNVKEDSGARHTFTVTQGNGFLHGTIQLLTKEQEISGMEDWTPEVQDQERRAHLAENNQKRAEIRQFAQQVRAAESELAVTRDQAKEEDFAAGRTLVDVHGNLVRVDQRLDRPDNKTLQVINLVKRSAYASGGLRKYAYNGSGGARLDSMLARVEFNKSLPDNINELPGFLAANDNTIKVENSQLIIANMTDTDNVFAIGYFGKRDPNSGKDDVTPDLYVGTLTTGGGQTARQKLFSLKMDGAKEVSGLTRFLDNSGTVKGFNEEGKNGELYSNNANQWKQNADNNVKVWLVSENFVINNNGKVRNIDDFVNGGSDFENLLKNTAGQVAVFLKQDAGGTPSLSADVTSATDIAGGNASKKNIDLVITPDLILSVIKTLATSGDSLKTTY